MIKQLSEFITETSWGSASKRSFKQREAEAEYALEKKFNAKRDIEKNGQWYLYLDGKIWQKDGKPVSFGGKDNATKAGRTILAKNPKMKIMLSTSTTAKL